MPTRQFFKESLHPMKRLAAYVLSAIFLCVACHKPKPNTFGAPSPPPAANPFTPVDTNGNPLGVAGNALVTTGSGGTITIDGGTVTTLPGSVTTLQDSGVSVLGIAQVDPVPGLELNTLVVQPVPASQQVLIDAGTRCITDISWTNEGTITGYAQVFCGQYVLDAGGTAGAATAPNLQIRCPAGTICGIKLEAPLCCAGAMWYSGVDAGFLLQTSAPAMTLTAASLR
jgi:hypothetical protein